MRNLREVWKLFNTKGLSPPPLVAVVARCNAMMAEWVDVNGAVLRHQMQPLTNELIVNLLMSPGPPGWSWTSSYGVMWTALVHTLAQTGFRKAE